MADTNTTSHDHPHAVTLGDASGDGTVGVTVDGAGRFRNDGGEDSDGDGERDGADDAALERAIGINDLLLEVGHANHVVVLEAVAILDSCEEYDTVRTGPIRDMTNRLVTTKEFRRHHVETSLGALYGDGRDGGFVDRTTETVGNAYDWSVTGKGRELLDYLYELGIIEGIATREADGDGEEGDN